MNNRSSDYERNSMNLFRSSNFGILSTISKQIKDYPFGSFVTYVSSASRDVYLYLSDLAEHTENLRYKSQSSLTVFKLNEKGDIQNSARLTLIGDLDDVPDDEIENCRNRFYSLLPESKKYQTMHDFKFYKLQVKSARWIGGFGQIGWLEKEIWDCNPSWKKEEFKIIDHMNDDHQNTVTAALKAQHGIDESDPRIEFLCIDGYYALTSTGYYFISFPRPAITVKDYREVLIELAKDYKKYE